MSVKKFVISDTTPSSASTAVGDIINGLGSYDAIEIIAELVGATGGTLDVYLQTSPDNGTNWYDFGHYTQLTAGAAAVKYHSTHAIGSQSTVAPVVIGKNTTPALAAATFVGGMWGDRLRALYVAGASTSSGAAIVITILGYMRR